MPVVVPLSVSLVFWAHRPPHRRQVVLPAQLQEKLLWPTPLSRSRALSTRSLHLSRHLLGPRFPTQLRPPPVAAIWLPSRVHRQSPELPPSALNMLAFVPPLSPLATSLHILFITSFIPRFGTRHLYYLFSVTPLSLFPAHLIPSFTVISPLCTALSKPALLRPRTTHTTRLCSRTRQPPTSSSLLGVTPLSSPGTVTLLSSATLVTQNSSFSSRVTLLAFSWLFGRFGLSLRRM